MTNARGGLRRSNPRSAGAGAVVAALARGAAVPLLVALLVSGVFASSAAAVTTVRGATDPSVALRIEPDGASQTQTIDANSGQPVFFIQRLPATRVVRYVTIGSLGRDASCSTPTTFKLRIFKHSVNDLAAESSAYPRLEVATSTDAPTFDLSTHNVQWTFPATTLEAGFAYSFVLVNGTCSKYTQVVWDHNGARVDTDRPASGGCIENVKPPITPGSVAGVVHRFWHDAGASDSVPACVTDNLRFFDSSMPSGWLVTQSTLIGTFVKTPIDNAGGPCETDRYPRAAGTDWPAGLSNPYFVRDRVCVWSQYNRPGLQTADGWYYAVPWTASGAAPVDMYVRLGATFDDPPDRPAKYVALGDSYQSGEGAGDYDSATNNDANKCHRSVNAYPVLLHDDGTVPYALDFVACSGAVVDDLFAVNARFGEPAQFDHLAFGDQAHGASGLADLLGGETKLVTIGIGGNDLQFKETLESCIVRGTVPLIFPVPSCQAAKDATLFDLKAALLFPQLSLDGSAGGTYSRLDLAFKRLREQAPVADVLVLNYPRLFPYDGSTDAASFLRLLSPLLIARSTCQRIRVSDQLWINEQIRLTDKLITASARKMGFRPVSLYTAADGHELCHEGSGSEFFNGIDLTDGTGLPTFVESFHPTAFGHTVIADRVRQKLNTEDRTQMTIAPAQRIAAYRTISAGTPSASFTTNWPGSDVVMTLRSPSGRVIGRTTTAADVYHHNSPVTEVYSVSDPEPGEWTIELYGADVHPEGENVLFDFYEEPIPNASPTAEITMSQTGAATVEVSAAGSSDPEGPLSAYVWDFGDGTTATGESATHVYDEPGTYRVTLVVRDGEGALGFAAANQGVLARHYPWQGFSSPVNNQPTLNATKAGQAIPVKFSLGADEGLGIFASASPASQSINCATGAVVDELEQTTTAGGSSLSYDPVADRYTYVWKTDTAWAATCRRLIVTLDDGTRHQADFKLR